MGKRGGFLYALKKTFGCQAKEKREKRNRYAGNWAPKQKSVDLNSSNRENVAIVPSEDVKLIEAENEQSRQAYSVALATAAAAEAAVAAANAAAEVVRLTAASSNLGRSKEELAAIKIQTAFRGYLARRALRALRGLVRLKTMTEGRSAQGQVTTTLKCMQTMIRVQSEIRARRTRISDENSSMQRQLQQKRDKDLEKLKPSVGEDWDASLQSKEQIEAHLQHRQEAAIRRERALAYSYTHQQTWRNTSNSASQTFMDPNNPRWGWSWLERWMAARPWENGSSNDHKSQNTDNISINSSKIESPKSQKQIRPPSRQSPSTPKSRSASKLRPASSRGTNGTDDDSKSINSFHSERCRRHSVAGSSVRDDDSVVSTSSGKRYMAPTESARARSRLRSPLGAEKFGTPEKSAGGGGTGCGGSAKKRLSFSGSPGGPRRHSGPPKVDISPFKDVNAS